MGWSATLFLALLYPYKIRLNHWFYSGPFVRSSTMRFLVLLFLPAPITTTAFLRSSHSVDAAKVNGPLTSNFQDWLKTNGYASDNFARSDLGTQGSYGGKSDDKDKIRNTPVVFIHGNSDSALAAGMYSGWTNSIQYFLDKGYTTAVQNYTKAAKVHIVAHSMGVTLGRKIILGGKIAASDGETQLEPAGNCDIGTPLRFVDVFVGLSGAIYGMCNCAGNIHQPTCNHDDGFWPGDSCGDNKNCGASTMRFPCDRAVYAKFLTDLNQDFTQLAKTVVSAWSKADDVLQYGDNTWGKPTSLIPRSTTQKTYNSYTHMQTKESPESVADQYNWVNR
ncbi:hypothetical protein PRIPAC_97640, partial [Pristionchus pacificus]|uniref:Lipase n=1 Tax=Pristionchus pacificus TaxID=54126 RepID=A0A2A6D388_PRIPA